MDRIQGPRRHYFFHRSLFLSFISVSRLGPGMEDSFRSSGGVRPSAWNQSSNRTLDMEASSNPSPENTPSNHTVPTISYLPRTLISSHLTSENCSGPLEICSWLDCRQHRRASCSSKVDLYVVATPGAALVPWTAEKTGSPTGD